ncbi:DsbA family oxidoreductase [Sphingomonas lycopersici]|uniref:DsbA family oxidoreductase n=1 Tax=Sphingomonas lycopersici TaxID=2951807 RepID=A0AA41ZCH0_9SPHN|nr:DsbA family oxidoreductase [Sphingomonas lycopersici]MCW6537113.1 DsbA family oxidoreductase [Sphingomonas lycopersici]
MTRTMTFDVISDVVCPWCVIGLLGLERALAATGDVVTPVIRLQPFELNPDMPAGGQDIGEHLREKYGASAGSGGEVRERIRTMAAGLGFDMAQRPGARIYNTFDAHRLIDWAAGQGKALPLAHALFRAYFTDGRDPGDPAVLAAAAQAAGLDGADAVIAGDARAAEVRAAEERWRADGITSVPSIIVDGRYLIQGAQEPAAYERAIRRIAAEAA